MAKNSLERLDRNFAAASVQDGVRWVDARELLVDGRGFTEVESYYDRLPAKARGVVRDPVWELSQHSSGMCVRFETNAKSISVRWSVRFESLAMPHMPATGVSGLDLYGWVNDRWSFAGSARPVSFPQNEAVLIPDLDGESRPYLMYLPLYNGVDSVQVGVPEDASIQVSAGPVDMQSKPVVFYGTSITQGGCASRPGMSYPAILGRRLNRRTINLGFSGNGQSEPEVAQLLSEIDAEVFVINPLPNMFPQWVEERIEPLVQAIRKAQPKVPIVLVENITYQSSPLSPNKRDMYSAKNAALSGVRQRLEQAGTENLYHVDGASLLGSDCESTVDGSHPTDLGFTRMADAIEPALRQALQ